MKNLKVYYNDTQHYDKRMPNACFGNGDRTAYILTTDSIEALNKKFDINLWGEYDATLNIFANGKVNLMKMKYSYKDEEFIEQEIKVLTQEEFDQIQLIEV